MEREKREKSGSDPSPSGVMSVKTTVKLSQKAIDSLKKLAASRGISMGKAIADAIELEAFVQERRQQGGRVYVKDEDESVTELWLR